MTYPLYNMLSSIKLLKFYSQSSTEMTPSATYKPNVRTVVCQTLTVCCASYPMFIH